MSKLYDKRVKYEQFVRLTSPKETYKRYIRALEKFFSKFPEKTRVEDFVYLDIEDYKVLRQRDGVGSSTLNMELKCISDFWEWMLLRYPNEVVWNPTVGVKRMEGVKTPPREYVEENVLEAIGQACRDEKDWLVLLLPLTAGLTPLEMVTVPLSSLDIEGQSLSIDGRRIPLRADLLKLLLSSLESQAPESPVSGTRRLKTVHARWNRLLHRAGYHGITLRQLRHTYAVTLLRNGVDYQTVQTLLGQEKLPRLRSQPPTEEEFRRKLDMFPKAI
jgi:site-specific recombinase XerD